MQAIAVAERAAVVSGRESGNASGVPITSDTGAAPQTTEPGGDGHTDAHVPVGATTGTAVERSDLRREDDTSNEPIQQRTLATRVPDAADPVSNDTSATVIRRSNSSLSTMSEESLVLSKAQLAGYDNRHIHALASAGSLRFNSASLGRGTSQQPLVPRSLVASDYLVGAEDEHKTSVDGSNAFGATDAHSASAQSLRARNPLAGYSSRFITPPGRSLRPVSPSGVANFDVASVSSASHRGSEPGTQGSHGSAASDPPSPQASEGSPSPAPRDSESAMADSCARVPPPACSATDQGVAADAVQDRLRRLRGATSYRRSSVTSMDATAVCRLRTSNVAFTAIHKLRWLVILAFAVFLGLVAWKVTQLKPAQEPPQLLDSDSNFERMRYIQVGTMDVCGRAVAGGCCRTHRMVFRTTSSGRALTARLSMVAAASLGMTTAVPVSAVR